MRSVDPSEIVKVALERAAVFGNVRGQGDPESELELGFRTAKQVLDRLSNDPELLIPDVTPVHIDTVAGRNVYPLTEETGLIQGIRYATVLISRAEYPLRIIMDPSYWASITFKDLTGGRPTDLYWNRSVERAEAALNQGEIHLYPTPEAGLRVTLYAWETTLRDLKPTIGNRQVHLANGEYDLLVQYIAVALCAPMGLRDVPPSLIRERKNAEATVRRARAQKHDQTGGYTDNFHVINFDTNYWA